MSRDLILVGSGGCMRELVWQIQELNKSKPEWNIVGYIDRIPREKGMSVSIGLEELPCLGDDNYLLNQSRQVNVAICVGSPDVRKKIVQKLSQNSFITYPNLILGDTKICKDVKLGKGCIVSMGVCLSTNVTIKDFVFFNTGSMVCHDGYIENYVTLGPDVKLAGAVTVGANSELGIGAKVIQGVYIGANAIVGAGAVVVDDIKGNGTFVGVPAHQVHV